MGINHAETRYSEREPHRTSLASLAGRSVHAEEMCLDRLARRRNSRRIKLSLVIIKISVGSTPTSYHLSNSKPCSGCLARLASPPLGYTINRIYYSVSGVDALSVQEYPMGTGIRRGASASLIQQFPSGAGIRCDKLRKLFSETHHQTRRQACCSTTC